MKAKMLELNEDTLSIIEEIGGHMPGGFFIYRAEAPEELIYANKAVCDIFGCGSLEEFKSLTGYTFRGMVHPEDYDRISLSIVHQIAESEEQMDYAEPHYPEGRRRPLGGRLRALFGNKGPRRGVRGLHFRHHG